MSDPTLLRPSEIMISRGNAEKASRLLGWQARHRMHDVVRLMIEKEQSSNDLL